MIDVYWMLKLHVLNYAIVNSDERVPTELKKAIMQARTDKKLTQSQLAQVYYPSLYMSLIITLFCNSVHDKVFVSFCVDHQ